MNVKIMFQIEREIWEHCGQDCVEYEGLLDRTDQYWHMDGGEVCFSYDKATVMEYDAIEVMCTFEGPNYTIFIGDDGCGNRERPYIFTNALEVVLP
jgi:hypothetical protein